MAFIEGNEPAQQQMLKASFQSPAEKTAQYRAAVGAYTILSAARMDHVSRKKNLTIPDVNFDENQGRK